jgi:Domain of unknown function (DUF1929)/PKD domain
MQKVLASAETAMNLGTLKGQSRGVFAPMSKVFGMLILVIGLAGMWAQPANAQANVTGTWATLPTQMPINPVHVFMMHNGQVLIVSGSGNLPSDTDYEAAVWNPQTDTVTTQPINWDMFCNGAVILPDGRPFIMSGTAQYDPFHGELFTSAYNPVTGIFNDMQPMAHGRWYPTATTLGTGQVMVFSGLDENGNTNTTVEIYTVGKGWSTPYQAPWTPPLYPRMTLLPNGNVFYSGSTTSSAIFNPTNQTWTTGVATTNYSGTRTYGTSVLLPMGPSNNYKPVVMIMGGGSPATNTTELIDLSKSSPAWVYGPNMSQPRIEMDGTILPNGKILATNGSTNDEDATTASLNADMYDPVANTFSSAGVATYPRLYHSGALLLQDGTVLILGGNPSRGTYEPYMEIYTPPYLYTSSGTLATRPTITSAPTGPVGYGASFQVGTSSASSISSVALIRAGAVTHAFDMDQRMINLAFTAGTNVLNITSPPNSNIAPPGWYHLFILNSSGVPSVSQFIQLSSTPNDTPPTGTISSPTGNVTIAPGASVSFSGSGSSPSGTISSYSWIFPGGSPATSTSSSPGSVTFANSGTYVASLTVTDNNGVTDPNPPTRTITVTPDFQISAAPVTQTVAPGSSATYTVTVTPATGFTSTVALTASGAPSGATVSFSPTSINTSGTSTMTVTTSSSTPTGSSTITVTGTVASLVHTAPVTLNVSTSGVSGKVISLNFVGSGTAMASTEVAGVVAKSNWNQGTGASNTSGLALVNETGTATTVKATWTADNTWVLPITDAAGNVRMMRGYLDNGYGDNSTVTVSGLPTNSGGYNVYVYADGDNSTNSRTGIYQISGSGITTTSISLTDAANTNFSGTFTQANNSNGNYVVFTIGASATGFTITAIPSTASSSTERAPLNGIQIVPIGASNPNFSLSASPMSATSGLGSSTQYTVTVTPSGGFTGAVALSVISGLPANATASFSPTSVTTSGSSTLTISTPTSVDTGSYTLTIQGSNGSTVNTTTVALSVVSPDFTISANPTSGSVAAGGSAQSVITISPLYGFNQAVTFGATGLPTGATAAFSPTSVTGSGTTTMTIATTSTTATGTYSVTVTGTGTEEQSHSVTYSLTITGAPTFTLGASPSSVSVAQGATGTYAATVTAVNGFTGSVALTASGLPTGATAAFSPTSVTGSGSSTMTVTVASTTATGSSTVTIKGTSGSITQTATATLVVTAAASPNFSLSVSPSSVSVVQGAKGTYTATVSALNGFTGTVTLGSSGLPTGATAAFSPTTISGSGSSTMTVTTASTTPTGSSTLTVSGTSGTLSHTATTTLVVTSASGTSAKPVSINFVGTGTAMASTESAGVVAETNWNQATGASNSTGLSLVDATGASNGSKVSWTADNTWKLPITDAAGNVRMMEGYLDNGFGDNTVVTVSGLPTDANGYTIYVYADGDNSVNNRSGIYQISGTGITTTSITLTDAANTNFSGTFTKASGSAGNYVVFTGIKATGFTLTAIPSTASTSTERAPVNGIQIIPN